MTLNKTLDGTTLTIEVCGRLDTTSSTQLENEIQSSVGDIDKLVLDFGNLEYISSAGLRVLMKSQKLMGRTRKFVLVHVSETIKEVFELTGFMDFLTIE